MHISFAMDVEDLIAEEADDAAMWCADIIRQEGAQATMCVVGEKARLLRSRGRADVIGSLSRHDIGIHSDMHSVHPTIVEYLVDKGWEDGIAEAVRREGPGVEAIRAVFGVNPSTWATPGPSWGPQISAAMRALGVPAIVYAHTRIPGGGVHRYAGTRAYPYFLDLNDGDYHRPLAAQANLSRVVDELIAARDAGTHWRGVFLGHPTRILHEEFWDAPNFSRGANPPRAQWRPARRKSAADLAAALAAFRTAVRTIVALPGIEVRTIAEMNAIYDRSAPETLSAGAQREVWPAIETSLRRMVDWPIIPADLDLGRLCEVARAQLGTLQREVA